MPKLLFIFFFIYLHTLAFSQPSDFISVRKKNGRHIKTFIEGSRIVFKTIFDHSVEGPIKEIKSDSISIQMFYTQTIVTPYGARIFDTIGSYTASFHFREIKSIKLFSRSNSLWSKIDRLLYLGGGGYFLLNLANGAYLSEPITSKDNLQSLGISLGAVGAGLLISRYFRINNFSRKRHKIVYVNMTR